LLPPQLKFKTLTTKTHPIFHGNHSNHLYTSLFFRLALLQCILHKASQSTTPAFFSNFTLDTLDINCTVKNMLFFTNFYHDSISLSVCLSLCSKENLRWLLFSSHISRKTIRDDEGSTGEKEGSKSGNRGC
jgi:hypothetical protein